MNRFLGKNNELLYHQAEFEKLSKPEESEENNRTFQTDKKKFEGFGHPSVPKF